MGFALKLATSQGVALRDVPAIVQEDPWQTATATQRALAELHYALVREFIEPRGIGAELQARALVARVAAGCAPASTMDASRLLTCGLSVANVKRLILKARAGGLKALLPGARGKRRLARGWEATAKMLWDNPAKRDYAGIAFALRGSGWPDVTPKQVQRYLASLPKHIGGPNSIKRVGRQLYGQTRVHYQRRSTDSLLVGEVYAGDGHTVDCYVAHPNNPKGLFRPELTAFIDTKSRFIVGWWFSESETKESTLFALGKALVEADHVPGWLYLDHGAGYRAQMLSDFETGWFKKFEIAVTAAHPGNPKGKGWIERFFRTVRDRHDKFFSDGATYCGDDMAQEANRRLSTEVKQGKRILPSYESYVDSFQAWLERYHDEPQDVLEGRTPRQVWTEGLQRVPVYMDHQEVLRPRVRRKVGRQEVRLHKRSYFHEALIAYDGVLVDIEYDLHQDSKVWVRDLDGRLIVEAQLVSTIGVIPASRLEEQRDRREAAQVKRLERHADEARRRREDPITSETQMRALEDLSPDFGIFEVATKEVDLIPISTLTESPAADGDSGPDSTLDIDILSWKDSQV